MTFKKLTMLIIFFIFFLIFAIFAGFFIFFQDKIYPQTFLTGVNLSGRTTNEAEKLILESFSAFLNQKIKFQYREREWEILNNDFVLDLNIKKNVQDTALSSKTNILICFLKPCYYSLKIELKENNLQKTIANNFQSLEQESKDAQIILENQEVLIVSEIKGLAIDQAIFKETLEKRINNFDASSVLLPVILIEPRIKAEDLLKAKTETEKMLASKLFLSHQGKVWEIPALIFSDWIIFQSDEKEKITPALSKEQVKNYLQENIASEIEIEPKNALFKAEEGKIIAFELGHNGKKIDYEKTIGKIENYFKNSQEQTTGVEIESQDVQAEVSSQNAEDLGLKTLLATGESDFAGSPQNRIHNIKLGASKFNGVLVKPGEEFSFNAIIGEVNERSGYKPELVIKPDGIKPEYGGGLCQVATTVFRAMLNAGVPITQRSNHSLLVSYYKPYGTDATTYPGVHDVKFINDTPGHILIQTYITGAKLYFDFFGTNDNRKIIVGQPQYVSEFVDPGPAKEIPTDSLKKGEKKQVSNAFNGVSTVFYRTVAYEDGTEKKDKFFSKYKPWKAVYFVGTKE